MQGAHAFGRLVREKPRGSDDLVELQVQVTEVRAHEVPVGLLSMLRAG